MESIGILLSAETGGGAALNIVSQLAHVRFDGLLAYIILIVTAVFICMRGYKIYRVALAVIGFAVGFIHTHDLLDILHVEVADQYMLLVQAIVGLICAGIAWRVWLAGIFIAVYHFVHDNLSGIFIALLAKTVTIPEKLYPFFAALAGIAIAALIAFLATKFERVVVISVTAALGGFAALVFFRQAIPLFPEDLGFLEKAPEFVWVLSKLLLSFAGFMVQGGNKKGK